MQERRKDFNKVVFDPIEPSQGARQPLAEGPASKGAASRRLAFADHSQVEGVGEVVVILGEGSERANPQKFMLRLSSGATLLIEHDTGKAPRVDGLALGDEVAFCGEYVYDMDGNVIRRTCKGPSGGHASGWLRHNGRTYQ